MAEKEQQIKVLIPCAGKGERLGELTDYLNKCLVPVNNKPIISYIVEKFSDDIEIVIALGYAGDYIRQFLELVYPYKNFNFIYVDKYEGEGAGLGYSILQCEAELQCPFLFIPNDTIVEGSLSVLTNIDHNIIAYSNSVHAGDHYRGVYIKPQEYEHNYVADIIDKKIDKDSYAYTGICKIRDYSAFWYYMKNIDRLQAIKDGESFAVKQMLKNGFHFSAFNLGGWYDTGTKNKLDETRERFKKFNSPNLLEKPNEAIWFVGNSVIKFHTDTSFIDKRVKRSARLHPYVPNITNYSSNMYVYDVVDGEVFSKVLNKNKFNSFLKCMKDFWSPVALSDDDQISFFNACRAFYYDKTYKRVEEYFSRFGESDTCIVNGEELPSIYSLLSSLDWYSICNGYPCNFHGDLHFENIIEVSNSSNFPTSFALLDWRQDFDGILDYGDIYYDFAKLLHGIIISHELINKNHYILNKENGEIEYDFLLKNSNLECKKILENFVKKEGFNWEKVNIMTALVYLNIAPLHHEPYSHLLFYLGKDMLNSK